MCRIFRSFSRWSVILLLWMVTVSVCAQAVLETPYQAETVTNLNVRSGWSTAYRIKTTLAKGESVEVINDKDHYPWVQVRGRFGEGWANSNYLQVRSAESRDAQQGASSGWNLRFWKILEFGFDVFLFIALLGVVLGVLKFLIGFFEVALVVLMVGIRLFYTIISAPFFVTNTLQRWLAKPWMILFMHNHFSDETNEVLREVFQWLKIPLYILLAPVRLINAMYFNLVTHLSFELVNYVLEVFFPSHYDEGADGVGDWIVYLPVRLLKYGIYHPFLTVVESLIWTVADVFFPALTLYHGTSSEAAEAIVSCPDRRGVNKWSTGVWNVGGGNFAGDGIYFASASSTSKHYGTGALIVCRVTLGRTLDLGLAPNHVYNQCGHANAHGVTDWGLKNGFTTGEWWRSDCSWWEYCMYDWKNRYNYSWRIRPLYVLEIDSGYIQRIPCGMAHWLFREMVVADIMTTIENELP